MDRDTKPENEPRMDKVEEARWRIAAGYYDLPDVLEEVADRLARKFNRIEPSCGGTPPTAEL